MYKLSGRICVPDSIDNFTQQKIASRKFSALHFAHWPRSFGTTYQYSHLIQNLGIEFFQLSPQQLPVQVSFQFQLFRIPRDIANLPRLGRCVFLCFIFPVYITIQSSSFVSYFVIYFSIYQKIYPIDFSIEPTVYTLIYAFILSEIITSSLRSFV